jgi:serine/threonine-protein kinase
MDGESFEHMEKLLKDETKSEFEIHKMLGRGGMAVVYLATETHLRRKVAIKVLPPELTFGHGVDRFKREAQTAAALDHPNIIPIYRIASGGKLFWYAMKFLEGRSLEDVIRERKKLPLDETVYILSQVAEALDYAHEHSVIHRDVKPANVMLDGRNRVIVTDFGIAKALTERTLTASGSVVGTPYYMSPEQGMGKGVSGRSDQYSVAVMAYRMLSGQVPFEGESAIDILHKHVMEPPPQLESIAPGLPANVYRAVHRALEKKQDQRFPSVTAFVDALSGAMVVAGPAFTGATTGADAATVAMPSSQASLAAASRAAQLPTTKRQVQPAARAPAAAPKPKKGGAWKKVALVLVLAAVAGGGLGLYLLNWRRNQAVASGRGRPDSTGTSVAPASNPASVAQQTAATAPPSSEIDEAPTVVTLPPPEYPPALRAARIEGRVVLEAVIDTTGHPEPASIKVVSSTNAGFEASARDALRQAVFRPGRVRGQAVQVKVQQPVEFDLPIAAAGAGSRGTSTPTRPTPNQTRQRPAQQPQQKTQPPPQPVRVETPPPETELVELPSQAGMGLLVLRGAPLPHRLFVDGRPQLRPRVELPAGTHEVRVTARGRPPFATTVSVVVGQRTLVNYGEPGGIVGGGRAASLQPQPAAPGALGEQLAVLQMRIQPWANVTINGIALGPRPIVVDTLVPGTHLLHFERDGFVTKDTTITLKPGETARLAIKMVKQQ